MVRSGSEPAFEAIYDRYHRQILSFCRHLVGNRQEAEDAVQQTFLAAYNGLRRSDQPIALRPWLYTIARNQSISALRAQRDRAVPDIDALATVTDGLSDQVQHREDLRELLVDMRRLPDDQRAALVLSELGDLSHDEIAEVIGVRTDKVKALVFQARGALSGARSARAIPCQDIREQIATGRGGELRRAPLRRHVAGCDGCRGFRDEVVRQRRAMAILLPVIPSAGLEAGSLPWLAGTGAGVGAGAAGGAAVGGGGAAVSGGGLAAFAGTTTAKALLVGVIAVGGTAGAVGVHELGTRQPADTRPTASSDSAAAKGPSTNASPVAAAPTPPQSISTQGVTPLRRPGKGGNAERARAKAKAKARKKAKKRAKLERGRSDSAPGRTKDTTTGKGNGSGKGGGSSNAGGNGNGNGSGQGSGSSNAGSGNSNAGGNGNGNGPPATRPAPVVPETAPTTGGGSTNSNGNGAIYGGGAKANGEGATKEK